MIMGKRNRMNNNSGSGLVSVIIAMAFVAVLGSIVMSASMTNFKMKQTNVRTKDSFYSAEQAVNEINIGLQNVISNSISSAYIEVLENYSAYDINKKNALMESVYFTNLWAALGTDSAHTNYDITKLTAFLQETAWTGDIESGYGAILSSPSRTLVSYADDGVVLKDLEVYYKDQEGYVSIIKTDIKLALPKLRFASNTVIPDLAKFSLIADDKFVTGTSRTNIIKGNLYAGELEVAGTSAATDGLTFVGANQVVVKKTVLVKNAALKLEPGSDFWAKDVKVDSADILLQGAASLADDILLEGKGSNLTVTGTYNGYGNRLDDAGNSSAILVNGTDAVVDLSGVDTITLAGHAYIGTQKVNTGSIGGVPAVSGNNVITGESIAVKSNQLMYLIPGECIGIGKSKNAEGNIIYGKSIYGKNPLSASEYQEIMNNPDNYEEIRADMTIPKLGKSLSEYIKYVGGKPHAQKVFVQGKQGTLVYYYISFESEEKANMYFRDYYGINKNQVDAYMDFYTNGITMKRPVDMLRLQLAGNMLKYDAGNKQVTLQENTVVDASAKLTQYNLAYERTFQALCTKIVTNYAELTDVKETDLNNNIVFENIVDVATLTGFVNANGTGSPKSYLFEDTTNHVASIFVDNKGGAAYTYSGSSPDIKLIIATGDVVVAADYTGLIFADGTITLHNGVKITADEEQVKTALKLTTTIDSKVYNVIGFLWDGAEFLNVSTKDDDTSGQPVQLADLVIYENWSKE